MLTYILIYLRGIIFSGKKMHAEKEDAKHTKPGVDNRLSLQMLRN